MPNFQYTRIALALRERLARQDYLQGRLPSERALMVEFGVQRDTVRRALEILEEEGLVYRNATRGRFASPALSVSTSGGAILLAVRRTQFSNSSAEVQRGLLPTVGAAGRAVIWLDMLDHAGREQTQVPSPESLRARGVAAIALWPELPVDLARLRVLRDALPLVVLDRRIPGFEADFVGFDDAGGGRQLMEHLLRQGHRRIGFISTEPLAATVQARVQAWATALEAVGMRARPEWVLHAEGGIHAMAADRLPAFLEAGGESLTAVVCANDTIAAQLIHFLRSRGRRVPDDLAVTGFGNMLPPLLDALGLTTMAQPFAEMGRVAGQLLLSRLRHNTGEVREVDLPMDLIVRESSRSSP